MKLFSKTPNWVQGRKENDNTQESKGNHISWKGYIITLVISVIGAIIGLMAKDFLFDKPNRVEDT
jgi:hypothetical protein